MAPNSRVVSTCLIGLAIGLLVVGVVSGTSLRHVIQIPTIFLAAVVVVRRLQVSAMWIGFLPPIVNR